VALRGPTLFPNNTQTDSPPAGVCDIKTTSVALLSGTVTGNTSAPLIFQISPTSGSGTLATASAANTTLANNKGWWIAPTTDMAGGATAQRLLVSGAVITLKATVTATGLTGNDTATFSLYKRASGGALTFIQSATFTAANGATGTVTTGTATITLGADMVFDVGETLYVELYLTVVNQTVTAGTATVGLGAATAWTFNNPNGICYRYLRSASDSAPADDTLTRLLTRVRSITDSAPASDTLTRGVSTFNRSTSDSAPAADTLTRQLILHRTVTENLGAGVDWPLNAPTKAITGLVYTGSLLTSGATCRLLRDSDEFLCGTVTTGSDGAYSFARGTDDPNTYHVEVYVGSTLHGLTDRGLVPQ
jgi:hypothetical protein